MNSRLKLSLYNMLYGFLGQTVVIIVGIVVPRLILVNLGSESNGLINSLNQLLTYLTLLEMGVGNATTQALYKAVGNTDQGAISRILSATNKYYKRTGLVYSVIVFIIATLYPIFVKSSLSYFTVFLVIIFGSIPNIVSYFYQAKYKLLLKVEGKRYFLSNITTITTLGINLSKVVLINLGFNIVVIQFSYLIVNLIQTAYFVLYIKKHYKWINLKAEPDELSISQKKYAIVHEVSSLIFYNTDIVLITMFLGLESVSVYSIYNMLYHMIHSILATVRGSFFFAMGQTYATDKNKYIKLHDLFEVCDISLSFSLFCIANIFILPFIKLYTAGVTDVQYMDQWLPWLFVATYLLDNGRVASVQVVQYAGHFQQTAPHAIVESVINLSVSIVAIKYFGIYGVLIGTIAALLYRANHLIIYSTHKLLKRGCWCTYRRWIISFAMFCVIAFGSNHMQVDLSTYPKIFFWAIVSCIVIIPVFFGGVLLTERDVCKYIKSVIKRNN